MIGQRVPCWRGADAIDSWRPDFHIDADAVGVDKWDGTGVEAGGEMDQTFFGDGIEFQFAPLEIGTIFGRASAFEAIRFWDAILVCEGSKGAIERVKVGICEVDAFDGEARDEIAVASDAGGVGFDELGSGWEEWFVGEVGFDIRFLDLATGRVPAGSPSRNISIDQTRAIVLGSFINQISERRLRRG